MSTKLSIGQLNQQAFCGFGVDMTAWSTVSKFAHWLALAPDNRITGERVIRRGTKKVVNRATQAFCMAAQAVWRSDGPIGRYDRRMKSKHGPQLANTATAHKLARIVYSMLKNKTEYRPHEIDDYEAKRKGHYLNSLKQQTTQMGYKLVQMNTP